MKNSEEKKQFTKLHELVSVHLKADGTNASDTDGVINYISEQDEFSVKLRCEMSAKFALVSLAASLTVGKVAQQLKSLFTK